MQACPLVGQPTTPHAQRSGACNPITPLGMATSAVDRFYRDVKEGVREGVRNGVRVEFIILLITLDSITRDSTEMLMVK